MDLICLTCLQHLCRDFGFNLEYPGFLPSDILHGVPEQTAVIKAKRCDPAHPWLPVDQIIESNEASLC